MAKCDQIYGQNWDFMPMFPIINSQIKTVTTTGCPKKMHLLSSFEFLTLGKVFLGVKNNSKKFGNKNNIGLLSKILSKLTLFIRKMQKC